MIYIIVTSCVFESIMDPIMNPTPFYTHSNTWQWLQLQQKSNLHIPLISVISPLKFDLWSSMSSHFRQVFKFLKCILMNAIVYFTPIVMVTIYESPTPSYSRYCLRSWPFGIRSGIGFVTWIIEQNKQKKKISVSLSPQGYYTGWATGTCRLNLVPTFLDNGVSRDQRCGSPPWLLVRKRTIPTERPPLVDEI
jgi:hypothetical protein